MKTCVWCSNEFQSTVSYQIYCCVDCREQATRKKISDRYDLAKIKKRAKKERKCAGGCGTIISMYNDNGFCNVCMVNNKKVDKTLKELRNFFEYEKKQ